MASDKTAPLGICDHCGAEIPRRLWYTSKRLPRRYCSVDCRNTANSHNGEPIRYKKLIERVARGEWRNPAETRPPTPAEQSDRSRKGRLREVEAGIWRNPALDPDARQKLSRPRRHSGDLAQAIEKLDSGLKMADLNEVEREAYLEYRQALRDKKKSPQ